MDTPFVLFEKALTVEQQRKGCEGLEKRKRKEKQMADIQRGLKHDPISILHDICGTGNFIRL